MFLLLQDYLFIFTLPLQKFDKNTRKPPNFREISSQRFYSIFKQLLSFNGSFFQRSISVNQLLLGQGILTVRNWFLTLSVVQELTLIALVFLIH